MTSLYQSLASSQAWAPRPYTSISRHDGRVELLRSIIGYVVTAAWAFSFILDALLPHYDAPVSVHAVMMIVAGAVFGGQLWKRNNGNNGNNERR